MQRGNIVAVNRIQIIEGDITKMKVDAIVNAANTTLLGGGGVDGAIHRAAGEELLEECRTLGGCATGAAVLTRGYRLAAKYVIHTAGPVWTDGTHGEPALLVRCYQNCFALAEKNAIKTIAFPAISTGAYGFPLELATEIAIAEARSYLDRYAAMEKVVFVCFGGTAFETYQRTLKAMTER